MSRSGFEVRDLMNTYEKYKLTEEINGLKDRIKNIIGGHQFIMFVKKKDEDDIYATDEDGRLTFAKMKNPKDEDMPTGWEKEGNFQCTNLSRLVAGEPTQTIFGHKDMPNLEIIDDPESLIDMLLASSKGKKKGKEFVVQAVAPDNVPVVINQSKD